MLVAIEEEYVVYIDITYKMKFGWLRVFGQHHQLLIVFKCKLWNFSSGLDPLFESASSLVPHVICWEIFAAIRGLNERTDNRHPDG